LTFVNARPAALLLECVDKVMARPDVTFIARLILIAAGAVTALFVARDALNFPIIQSVVAILMIAAAFIAWAAFSTRR
jgi:hypothetical protein